MLFLSLSLPSAGPHFHGRFLARGSGAPPLPPGFPTLVGETRRALPHVVPRCSSFSHTGSHVRAAYLSARLSWTPSTAPQHTFSLASFWLSHLVSMATTAVETPSLMLSVSLSLALARAYFHGRLLARGSGAPPPPPGFPSLVGETRRSLPRVVPCCSPFSHTGSHVWATFLSARRSGTPSTAPQHTFSPKRFPFSHSCIG